MVRFDQNTLFDRLAERRRLGVAPLTRFDPQGYAPSVTQQVYRQIAERTLRALKAGHSVIADAVFASAQDREAIGAITREAGVRFSGVWIDAPPEVLARRIGDRAVDVSDAAPEVLERQMRSSGTGSIDWRRLDGSIDPETILRRAQTAES
jgi:predicted kinase